MRFCIMSSHLPLFSFTRMLDFSIPKRIETGQLFVAYLFFYGSGDTWGVKLAEGM